MNELNCMEGFRFIASGETSSDCTTPYTIKFDKEFTLGEFIKQILSKNEWGYIEIDNKKIEYKKNKIISSNPFEKFYYKHIINCTARGGWSNMDYHIVLDEAIDEFEFMLEEAKKQSMINMIWSIMLTYHLVEVKTRQYSITY